MSNLLSLGWSPSRNYGEHHGGALARVAISSRGQYWLLGETEPFWAPCCGRLLSQADDARDLPTVGDWVRVRSGVIQEVLPRSSCFVRKQAGRATRPQLICANVDVAFVVTAVGPDMNPRRIERYCAMVTQSGARPVVVINKSDLSSNASGVRDRLSPVTDAPIVLTSALEEDGLVHLAPFLAPRETVVFMGSSGVGKTSLISRLTGEALDTDGVRESDGRGRHTTTRRELFVAESGVILIDTPGMRELEPWEIESLDEAFSDIEALSQECRFRDCSHNGEPGCAVHDAVEDGTLDQGRLTSFHKLVREADHQERRLSEHRRRDAKDRWKSRSKEIRVRRKLNRKLGLKDI